jgi:hypothetical protein
MYIRIKIEFLFDLCPLCDKRLLYKSHFPLWNIQQLFNFIINVCDSCIRVIYVSNNIKTAKNKL